MYNIEYGLLKPDPNGEYLNAHDVKKALEWCMKDGIEHIESRINSLISQIDNRKTKPIIKFNGGRNALLCSHCNTIIDEGFDRDKYTSAMYCERCK